MDYPSINRRTGRFYLFYDGGPTIVKILEPKEYECFHNHASQADLLRLVCEKTLSDEEFDNVCENFLSRRKVLRYWVSSQA